jgi:predicted nucleotidyltransferase
MIKNIYNILPVNEKSVKNIYMFGSRVYGNYHDLSDYDFIVIGDTLKYQEITKGDINIHIFNNNLFQRNLEDFDMRAIECVMAPSNAKLKEVTKFKFKMNKKKFRESIFFQVNKNWRVGKKKFADGDVYGGKKRIYHSIRILLFAIQLLKKNKIVDWGEANQYSVVIKNDNHTEWDYYRLQYETLKQSLEKKINKIVK